MKKKCIECGKMYQPNYNVDRLNKASKYCIKCVEKLNKELDKDYINPNIKDCCDLYKYGNLKRGYIGRVFGGLQ